MKTIKTAIMILGVFSALPAFSEEAKVEVTSFRFAGSRTSAAELCGKITGQVAAPAYVKVLVDEKSKSPGIYNVIVGPELTFCTAVVTYYGTASASLWNQTQVSSASIQAREEH